MNSNTCDLWANGQDRPKQKRYLLMITNAHELTTVASPMHAVLPSQQAWCMQPRTILSCTLVRVYFVFLSVMSACCPETVGSSKVCWTRLAWSIRKVLQQSVQTRTSPGPEFVLLLDTRHYFLLGSHSSRALNPSTRTFLNHLHRIEIRQGWIRFPCWLLRGVCKNLSYKIFKIDLASLSPKSSWGWIISKKW